MAADGDDICIAREVVVEGKEAVWIFSEFETDESLPELVKWLTPEDWPKWGSAMFKEMKPVGPRTDVETSEGTQWHAGYLEVVKLVSEMHTVLSCDFKRTDRWAAMTYDLDHSVGNVLQVDRGFLLAADVAGRRQVKALKVVGFTDPVYNVEALDVCPMWTEWVRDATVRAAAEGDGGEKEPTVGTVGAVGDPAPGGGAAAGDADLFSFGSPESWASTVTDMVGFYGAYATDVARRFSSGEYGQKDAADDSARLFQRLARDWARTWRAGTEAVTTLAGTESPPAARPTGGSRESVEFTTVAVPAAERPAPVSVTDLLRVGAKGGAEPRLRRGRIKLDPEELGPGATSVRLEATTSGTPSGLYEGQLLVGGPGRRTTVPALFYVSRAGPAR